MQKKDPCQECKRALCKEYIEKCDDLNAAKVYEKCQKYEEAYRYYMSAANSMNSNAKYVDAREIYNCAAEMAKKLKDKSLQFNAISSVAGTYENQGHDSKGEERKSILKNATTHYISVADFAIKASLLDAACNIYMRIGHLYRELREHNESLIYYNKAITIAEELPIPQKYEFLHGANDYAGRACKSLKNSGSAKAYWDNAEKYAKLAGFEYDKPRYAEITVTASPTHLEVCGKNEDRKAYSTITTKITEVSGRITGAKICFSVRKEFGIIYPSYDYTNKDGIATAIFYPSGKIGTCPIKVEDNTGAEECVEITVEKLAEKPVKLEITQLKWLYPNSDGLYGFDSAQPHWKKDEAEKVTLPPIFGYMGAGSRPYSKKLEIELDICIDKTQYVTLKTGKGSESEGSFKTNKQEPNVPEAYIIGNTVFKPKETTRNDKQYTVIFEGKASNITTTSQKVKVKAEGSLPDDIGYYIAEINWQYLTEKSDEKKSVIDICKTKNDVYVTWKQSLPVVMFERTGTGKQIMESVNIGKRKKKVPRLYLQCLQISTKAIAKGGALEDSYPSWQLEGDTLYEVQMLDRIFDYINGQSPFKNYTRDEHSILNYFFSKANHQTTDILDNEAGDCGDWACFFHDLAAAQGIHVCIVAFGQGSSGENFCIYPNTEENETLQPSLIPIIYDCFRTRAKGKNGIRGSRKSDGLPCGGLTAYKQNIIKWLNLDASKTECYYIFNPGVAICTNCKSAVPQSELKCCPTCGESIY